MDFILRQLDSKIAVEETNTSKYMNLLRQRIDYVLFFSLAYVWDKNSDNIDFQEFSKIVETLHKMSIGKLVDTIRKLDESKEIFINKNVNMDLNSYPNFRNENHGHGYIVDEKVHELALELDRIYSVFIDNIPLFKKNVDIIFVTKHESGVITGLRFPIETNGLPVRWSCNKQAFNCEEPYIGRCFALLDTGEYIKLSPFIHLENEGDDRFIFVSLEEKLTGKIKYAQLLRTNNNYFKEWNELKNIFIVQNKHRRISANGTIMNVFENNYKEYIQTNVQIDKELNDFLLKDKSSVCCTIWGHGGVGKTALIQHIATNLFNQQRKKFEYIIFASAKDSKYNPVTGKIEEIVDNVRTFEDVIFTISSTLFDLNVEYEQFSDQVAEYVELIQNHRSKCLIIIDDFETFNDIEKKKLYDFIQRLNINFHKVVVTTRVKNRVIGLEIATSEFDEKVSKEFLLKIVEFEYNTHLKQIADIVSDTKKMSFIYKATSGRPIFLYQFAHLFVQYGFRMQDFEKLAKSENAQSFLYDRLYDYLSEHGRNLFVYIPQIISKENLSFNQTVLEYLVANIELRSNINEEIEELTNMRIILVDSAKIYRVYSDEILRIMEDYYIKRDEKFRASVQKLKQSLGETNFQGDVYEKLLYKADKRRRSENEENIMKLYRELLDSPKCSMEIKQKAIKNVTGHFETINNPRKSLELYKEYYSLFKDNQEIIRLYVRLLWNNKNDENEYGAEACAILSSYYKNRRVSDPECLSLFFIWVEYQGKLILQRRRKEIENAEGDIELISRIRIGYKVKLVNFVHQFGQSLQEMITQTPFTDLAKDSLHQHHLTNAIIQIVKAGTEVIILDDDNNNRLEIILNFIKYGMKNLQPRSHRTFRGCLNTIETEKERKLNDLLLDLKESDFQRFLRKNKKGDIIDFKITGIRNYGIFGKSDRIVGLMHKSNIPLEISESLQKHFTHNETIKIQIDSIDVQNERFSAKFISVETINKPKGESIEAQ
ncbi:NB-ARC domain-containing protein [Sutcliffiella horikoshii]|uniref:NB-ARC domain-containing protein n=1 Tax=Sutcliffiella horikoshii TaxID=79883 RepID=UPI003CEC8C06